MARVIVDLPQRFSYSTDVQIYVSHVNAGGHLDNAQLLTLVSEGRSRFFQWLGYTERDVEGYVIVVGDLVSQYKSEGLWGETLRVSMEPCDFNKYGFDLMFELKEKDSGREVARGKTGVVFTSDQTKKVVLTPDAFKQRLRQCIEHVSV